MKTKTTDNGVKHLEWVTKPEDATIYDDAFWIKKQRWNTHVSVGADDLEIITSLSEEQCIAATRWYLKQRQEGFTEQVTAYDGVVGGKI